MGDLTTMDSDIEKIARDIYDRIFRLGRYSKAPVPFDPLEEIRSRLQPLAKAREEGHLRHIKATDYSIALQRAIEHHCNGKIIPDAIAMECPFHVKKLDSDLSASRLEGAKEMKERIIAGIQPFAGHSTVARNVINSIRELTLKEDQP